MNKNIRLCPQPLPTGKGLQDLLRLQSAGKSIVVRGFTSIITLFKA